MKAVTLILIGLLLALGTGTVQAASESQGSNEVAVSANDAALLLDDADRTAALDHVTEPLPGNSGDEGLLASQAIPVWGYAVSNQVRIDLDFRPVDVEESSSEFLSNRVGLEQITQNFMLGFRYKF
jgi:hypothetical protein